METHVPTSITIPAPKIDIVIPSVIEQITDETDSLDNHIEIIKATYENEIAKLHENYQYIILKFSE